MGRGSSSGGGNFAPTLDSQDPDPEVIALNKDLANVDEALSSSLPSRKCKVRDSYCLNSVIIMNIQNNISIFKHHS